MPGTNVQPGKSDVDAALRQFRDQMINAPNGDRDDQSPVEYIQRMYQQQSGAAALATAKACATALLDPEVKVRSGAVHFFSYFPDAPDDGALVACLLKHENLYQGVADPFTPSTNLYNDLLRVTISHLKPQNPADLQTLHKLILSFHDTELLVPYLMGADLPWVEQHAVDIVRNSPASLPTLLYHLTYYKRPVLPVVQALRGVIPNDVLSKGISDELTGDMKDRALALLTK